MCNFSSKYNSLITIIDWSSFLILSYNYITITVILCCKMFYDAYVVNCLATFILMQDIGTFVFVTDIYSGIMRTTQLTCKVR